MNILTPNAQVSKHTEKIIVVTTFGVLLGFWFISPVKILPTPIEVLSAIGKLWREGLAEDMWASIKLSATAIVISTFISLAFAYASLIPAFKPLVSFVSKLRFMSMAGLTLIFSLVVAGQIKVAMLVFGITVFFVTSMADVVASIPKENYDHARTLGFKPLRTLWEVVILGRLDQAFDVLIQNAAVSWMMLTMVEGISRSEGGIGALLLNQNKHFHLAEVYGLQLVVLVLGLLQDFSLRKFKQFICPYAFIGLERN